MQFFTTPSPLSPTPTGVPVPYPNISRQRPARNHILFFDEADALVGKRS